MQWPLKSDPHGGCELRFVRGLLFRTDGPVAGRFW
jgi:hypothetical protein